MNTPMITMSDIVEKLERDDVPSVSANYFHLIDSETEMMVSQLRHRATMLRQRAEELDVIADGISKFRTDLVKKVEIFEDTHRSTLDVLQALAHINPTKVTNGA